MSDVLTPKEKLTAYERWELPSFDLPDSLQQRGAQGVVHRLGEDIGAGGHQVRADVERRARFEPAFDDDAGLVDLEGLADFLQVLLDERGERG